MQPTSVWLNLPNRSYEMIVGVGKNIHLQLKPHIRFPAITLETDSLQIFNTLKVDTPPGLNLLSITTNAASPVMVTLYAQALRGIMTLENATIAMNPIDWSSYFFQTQMIVTYDTSKISLNNVGVSLGNILFCLTHDQSCLEVKGQGCCHSFEMEHDLSLEDLETRKSVWSYFREY